MVTKKEFDLDKLRTLSTEDACILKVFFIRPEIRNRIQFGSSKHKEFFLNPIRLQRLCEAAREQEKGQHDALPRQVAQANFNENVVIDIAPDSALAKYLESRPIAVSQHNVTQFTEYDYSAVNQHGRLVPEEVRYTIHEFSVCASFRQGDMTFKWNDDNTKMKVEYKYSDPFNYPQTSLPLYMRKGELTFGPKSAMAQNKEENLRIRRRKDGNVWDGFEIEFSEPQETQTVSHGDGLTGFDLDLRPHQREDGITVMINFLIVATRNQRENLDNTVKASFNEGSAALNNSWMQQHQRATSGAPFGGPTQLNFGNCWNPSTNASNAFGGGTQSGHFNFGAPSFNPFPSPQSASNSTSNLFQPQQVNPSFPSPKISNSTSNPFQPQQVNPSLTGPNFSNSTGNLFQPQQVNPSFHQPQPHTQPQTNNPFHPNQQQPGNTPASSFTPFKPVHSNKRVDFSTVTKVAPAQPAAGPPSKPVAAPAQTHAAPTKPVQTSSTSSGDQTMQEMFEHLKLQAEQVKMMKFEMEKQVKEALQKQEQERKEMQEYKAQLEAQATQERARLEAHAAQEKARLEAQAAQEKARLEAQAAQEMQQYRERINAEASNWESQKQQEVHQEKKAVEEYGKKLQQENQQILENASMVVARANEYEQEVRLKKDSGPNKRLRHRAEEDLGRNTPIEPDTDPGINVTPRSSPAMNMTENQASPTTSDLYSYNADTMVQQQGHLKVPPVASVPPSEVI